jgi:hypothetical protein
MASYDALEGWIAGVLGIRGLRGSYCRGGQTWTGFLWAVTEGRVNNGKVGGYDKQRITRMKLSIA